MKAFSARQKYEGWKNSKSVGISSIVCCSLIFAYSVCVCVYMCLHCPHIGSDDSTMLTSQDALTLKTFIQSLPDSQVVRQQSCQPQVVWWTRRNQSFGQGRPSDRQAGSPPAVFEEFSLYWNGDAAKNNIKRQQQQGSFLSSEQRISLSWVQLSLGSGAPPLAESNTWKHTQAIFWRFPTVPNILIYYKCPIFICILMTFNEIGKNKISLSRVSRF